MAVLLTLSCAVAILLSILSIGTLAILNTVPIILRSLCSFFSKEEKKCPGIEETGFSLYKGIVRHIRKRPVKHSFSYSVNFAYIDMDNAPLWFLSRSSQHHMSSDDVRKFASTTGKVFLLTNPVSVGYEQNPISVFYCFEESNGQQTLKLCVAEVTNTPWADRCIFTFDPSGKVPKPLHVSPFMDMNSSWLFKTSPPGSKVHVEITADHEDLGQYFVAVLDAARVDKPVNIDWFLWMMPHKVAIGIYWQALLLWLKGVPLFSHPKYKIGDEYKSKVLEKNSSFGGGCVLKWKDASNFPWK